MFQQEKVLELWKVHFQIQNLPYTNGKTLGKSLNLACFRALKAHILAETAWQSTQFLNLKTVCWRVPVICVPMILASERLRQKDQGLRVTLQQVQGQPESKETHKPHLWSGTQETGQPGLHSETMLETKTKEQTKYKFPNLSLTHSMTDSK